MKLLMNLYLFNNLFVHLRILKKNRINKKKLIKKIKKIYWKRKKKDLGGSLSNSLFDQNLESLCKLIFIKFYELFLV